MSRKDKQKKLLKESPPVTEAFPKTPYRTKEEQDRMQKAGSVFHPLSRGGEAERQINERMIAMEHTVMKLGQEIRVDRNMKAAGINQEGMMKLIEDFIRPAINHAIADRFDSHFNVLNAKTTQIYELLGLGNYDGKKKNKMDTNLLELKKDLMRINFFRIMFDINEEEMRKLAKKVKKEMMATKGKK